VVGHEERIATVGSQLMDDRPKRCWPQTSLDLDAVPKLAPADAQAENGVGPAAAAALLVEHLKTQAQRLHGLDGGGQDVRLGFRVPVHSRGLSTRRGQMSIVDRARGPREDCPRNVPFSIRNGLNRSECKSR
jgi:hypothetical protein